MFTVGLAGNEGIYYIGIIFPYSLLITSKARSYALFLEYLLSYVEATRHQVGYPKTWQGIGVEGV